MGTLPRVNPFSVRFVEPGAIPYHHPGGLTELAKRFEAAGGWGEIVGPHGSGKSTLLASLLPHLTGWTVRRVRLTTSERALPVDLWPLPGPRPLLVIDGFEQLGWLMRRRVMRVCRRAGAGLLVTTHRSVGLPLLHRTDVTPAALTWVLARLLPADAAAMLSGFDAAVRLRAHRGSLRDVLFELYDRWEAGTVPPGSAARGGATNPLHSRVSSPSPDDPLTDSPCSPS